MANRVKGQITQFYPSERGCYIRIGGIPSADTPKNGLFLIDKAHKNYDSLFSFAMAAALARIEVTVRAPGEIDPSRNSVPVQYLSARW